MNDLMKCTELSKSFNKVYAIKNFSYTLAGGKMVGLLGPNGSGKTTLIRLAAGLLTQTSGEILVNGIAPCPKTKAQVSYLPDKLSLPLESRVREAIAFYADFYNNFDKAKANEMLAALGIEQGARFSSMSKGTKEKVQLVFAMSRAASLYLLDEPIGGVDPAARDYILNTIIRNYSDSASVLFSTHLIADVEKVLDDIIFINKGELALYGSAEELRETHGKSIDELFREVFKC